MKLGILCDAHWESKLDRTLRELSSSGYRCLFGARSYGTGLAEVNIVLMCRDPKLKFKQRIRFVKRRRAIYLDIMLDLDELRQAGNNARRKIVLGQLSTEVPRVLHKYA